MGKCFSSPVFGVDTLHREVRFNDDWPTEITVKV